MPMPDDIKVPETVIDLEASVIFQVLSMLEDLHRKVDDIMTALEHIEGRLEEVDRYSLYEKEDE